jgi:hypothetical protein
MAYELTIHTADNVSSTDVNSNVSNDVDESNLILSNRQSDFSKREATFDRPAHNYARYYVSDRVAPTTVVSSFESVVANADWVEIEGRHVWTEYQQDEYLHDETYYPHGMENGLRTPPEINYINGFGGKIAEAHFVIGGSEHSITDKKITLSKPTEYIRQDAVIVESDGSVSVVEGTEYPNPKENDIDWPKRPDIPTGAKVGAYVTVKSILDRIPRSGIEIVDVIGDDGERTVKYSHGTVPDGI